METPKMETPKIHLMLMSLGGTTAPLIKSIQAFQPQKIFFFASHDSVPLSAEILAAIPRKPECRFFITENPNSLLDCYTMARECVDRAGKSTIPSDEIMVDYTGGTKVMTAALLLAALGRSYHFNYVGGGMRNKNGLGTVMDGAEQMFSEASPWAVFAEEERRQIIALFNCRRFSAVIEIIGDFNRRIPPRIADYFGFILPLSQGFLLWDQFSHKAAQRNLEKGMTALEKYMETYPSGNLSPFRDALKICKTHLDEVVEKTNGPNQFDRTLVKDLINNARRKMADKRFDDAAARIYRALELYGQIIFKQVAKCDNSRVKPEVIPDALRENFKQKYYDAYIKHLKLPLHATFDYLRAMGHEAGIRYFKMEKEIKKIQSNRNLSILAHGVTPVSESGAESILATVSGFVGETDFFDFPKLPETVS